MAYTPLTLDSLFPAPIEGVVKFWLYRTADPQATVEAANYITDVTSLTSGNLPTGNRRGMEVGDFIFVISSNATPFGGLYRVSAIGASGVTLVRIAAA